MTDKLIIGTSSNGAHPHAFHREPGKTTVNFPYFALRLGNINNRLESEKIFIMAETVDENSWVSIQVSRENLPDLILSLQKLQHQFNNGDK